MNNPIASNNKAWFLLPVILLTMLFLSSCSSNRHVQDHNQYSYNPPPWAPSYGYRASTRYVFFPEIGLYYDLYQNNYIYPYGNSWMVVQRLPSAYSSYDLRRLRQQQLSSNRDPQRYSPDAQGSANNNQPVYTPRRGGTPTVRSPQNSTQRNQRPDTVNPPANNSRSRSQPSARPPQSAPNRTESTAPARRPVQTSPRGGNNPSVRDQQPVTRSQVPARVTPPQTQRGSQTAPQRTQSRRGGGAI